MLDIHCHILPGIDDGAPTIETSVDMLDAYARLGARTVVATPHLAGRLTDHYAARIERAFSEVAPLARDRGIALERGFEIALQPDTANWLAEYNDVSLAGSGTILVDLPFTEWPLFADSALFAVQAAGYQVILAHPERYPGIQGDPDKAEAIVDRGILLQVTIGSFSGAFGKRAQRAAETLLERGVVHILATDAHSAGQRMAAVPAGLARLRDLIGEEQLQRALVATPACILNDDPTPEPVRTLAQTWGHRIWKQFGL